MELQPLPVSFGSDPEIFIEKDGQIVGAEKVIPVEGIGNDYAGGKIILDGVQGEFTISPATSIHGLLRNIAGALGQLQTHLEGRPDYKVSFVETVDIAKEELASLSPKARELGCAPSLNIYDGHSVIKVPNGFPTRSAGGHGHLGIGAPIWSKGGRRGYTDERRTLVPMFDWAIACVCVLLNRGEEQAKRRLTYGRAGEYRLPAHGLEYRTLSNFWLRDPILTEFVFGMYQFVINVLHTSLKAKKGLDDLMMKDFTVDVARNTIDKNVFDDALKIYDLLTPFFSEYGTVEDPLNKETVGKFRNFVIKSSIDEVFPRETSITRWMKRGDEPRPLTWSRFISAF